MDTPLNNLCDPSCAPYHTDNYNIRITTKSAEYQGTTEHFHDTKGVHKFIKDLEKKLPCDLRYAPVVQNPFYVILKPMSKLW